MNTTKFAEISAVLGNENRLKIVLLLKNGTLCACKILENLNITQPTLSSHIKILKSANLINAKSDGKWQYYTLNYEILENFKEFLNQNFNAENSQKGCEKC